MQLKKKIIAIDTKNLALYSGGIAAFFKPLLLGWIKKRVDWQFTLIGPSFDAAEFSRLPNCNIHIVPWPKWVFRFLRHPFYDNFLFTRAVAKVKPDAVFTPYHDVRLPRGVVSAMMIHDTCLHDLPDVYPMRIRCYYLHMLKNNLKVVNRVITVSKTSKRDLLMRYGLTDSLCGVVPNTIDPRLLNPLSAKKRAEKLRKDRRHGMHLFYPGGSEHRKNISRMCEAIVLLSQMGEDPYIWITGQCNDIWLECFKSIPAIESSRFCFLGRLEIEDLAAQYRASDAVVYPTLCEGFGRVALEAMELGVPIACSDIEVIREVAGDYPVYFNPRDSNAIANAIKLAAKLGPQAPRHYQDYQPEYVLGAFIAEMDIAFSSIGLAS